MNDFSQIYLPENFSFLRPFIIFQEDCMIENVCNFQYYLLKKDILPYIAEEHGYLKYMVGHAIGTDIFYLSENIPAEYRKYVIFHEYYEFKVLAADYLEKCPLAIRRELELVPKNMRIKYIKFRYEQFLNLLQFHKDLKSSDKFLQEIKKSIKILTEEVW